MSILLGIDVGAVSVKIAVISYESSGKRILSDVRSNEAFYIPNRDEFIKATKSFDLLVTKYQRIMGNPVLGTYDLLKKIIEIIPACEIEGVRVCGSGSSLIGEILGINTENEFRAIARGAGILYPSISTVFEMGGQNSKYILIDRDEQTGRVGITDYDKSGDCAAGTGSFLDQQASRLKFNIESIGQIVKGADKSAKIAGRCSVFAKSDMIHAQQKGYTPPEVLKGLCEAVARNFKNSIVKGKKVEKPVLFIGGVAMNSGVVNAMHEVFKLSATELLVPEYYAWIAAIGTAIAEGDAAQKSGLPDIEALLHYSNKKAAPFSLNEPLSLKNVTLLRNKVKPRILKNNDHKVDAYLGVDVGSVSTNLAVIDSDGNMLKEIYTPTEGRPIEVVNRCFKEIDVQIGSKITIKGAGTTGSGRELIGELIGADTINDEITAHKTGAEFIARTMLNKQPDTIFEIGGQDSKFISIENGVVVDFAMNEACAAGTGSFLEERAEELGISIKEEYAKLALSSRAPIKLGERCTVFMQQDVSAYQQRGADKVDLAAGLAYSIAYNYLNRVVHGRKIGNVIFFQGGTAYNNAIASAFARILKQEIIVPPYNGIIGAVGVALLAREKMIALNQPSKFRGFSLENINYSLREFTCKACSNYCHMQEFTVENEKTYWGDQCSDKFRRRQTAEKPAIIEDLPALRRKLLYDDYNPEFSGKATIGLPRAMYIYEQFPFWNTFFRRLGYGVLLSDETNRKILKIGIEASVAEPCVPIQAYHGHVQNLLDQNVDLLFIPNLINAETPFKNLNSYYCPWGQTLPFVIRSSPAFLNMADKLISPAIRFRDGKEAVARVLTETFKPLGKKKKLIIEATEEAYEMQDQFRRMLLHAGKRAIEKLEKSDEIGIILIGRTYNVYDRCLTLDIGSKLRDYYGINVIPLDFLPVDSVDISDINANMYWNYGRKIIAAAKIVSQFHNLHIIYLTNFKCGPDSYIKHYITKASGKPFLTLQFDEHSNDAGYLTRCEAYLDSKGALRSWNKNAQVA
jgi:predicted CoA-substrate-specific enzyme activase